MRIVISGSRTITDAKVVESILRGYLSTKDTVLVGGAKGVDTIAEDFARRYFNEVIICLPDWDKHGKAAGPIRNAEMLGIDVPRPKADQLIAIWDGQSRGTKSTIGLALRAGIETHVHFVRVESKQGQT